MTTELDPGTAAPADALPPPPSPEPDLPYYQARGYAGLGQAPTPTMVDVYGREIGVDPNASDVVHPADVPEFNTGIDWQRYNDQVQQALNPSEPPSSDELGGITAAMASHWLGTPIEGGAVLRDPYSGKIIPPPSEQDTAQYQNAMLGLTAPGRLPGPGELGYGSAAPEQFKVGQGPFSWLAENPGALGPGSAILNPLEGLGELLRAHEVLSAAGPEAARLFRAAIESRAAQGAADFTGAAGRAIHDVGPQAAAALDRLAPAAGRFAREEAGMARIDLGLTGPGGEGIEGGLSNRIGGSSQGVGAGADLSLEQAAANAALRQEAIAKASADFNKAAESVNIGKPPSVDLNPAHTDATVVRAARLGRSALGDEFDATRAALRLGKETDAEAAARLVRDQRPALEDATRRAGVDPTPENVQQTAESVVAHAQERNAAITARDAKGLTQEAQAPSTAPEAPSIAPETPAAATTPVEAPVITVPTQYGKLIEEMRKAGATDSEIAGLVGRDNLRSYDVRGGDGAPPPNRPVGAAPQPGVPGSNTGGGLRTTENLLSAPKTLLTTSPIHAALRQALPFIAHPVEYTKALGKSTGAFVDALAHPQAAAKALADRTDQLRAMADAAGGKQLYVAKPGFGISGGEEQIASNLFDKVPILGRLVSGSKAAFVTMLNEVRVNTFVNAAKTGLSQAKLDELANTINHFSGRGFNVTGAASVAFARSTNSVFFSPQLAVSRARMLKDAIDGFAVLGGNIANREALDPVALEKVRLAGGYVAGVGGMFALAKGAGLDVDLDPTSTNFMRIDLGAPGTAQGVVASIGSAIGLTTVESGGHVWLDPSAGESALLKTVARLFTGRETTGTGREIALNAGGRFPTTYADVVGSFLRGKLGPIPGKVMDLALGKDALGNPFTVDDLFTPDSIGSVFLPIMIQDFFSAGGFDQPQTAPAAGPAPTAQPSNARPARIPGGIVAPTARPTKIPVAP